MYIVFPVSKVLDGRKPEPIRAQEVKLKIKNNFSKNPTTDCFPQMGSSSGPHPA